MMLDRLFLEPQYERPQAEKERLLLPEFVALTRHHAERCPAFARIAAQTAPRFEDARTLADLPFIPAELFKTHDLRSVPREAVRMTLTSSGTTGQAVSRIAVDGETARNQSRALMAIMRGVLGDKRLPMLLIESEETLRDRKQFNARAAGVLGMMMFGRAPVFALDADMKLKKEAVRDFLGKHGHEPFMIFGFTFMVWKYFYQAVRQEGLDLSQGILFHSGGWKKLEAEAVDNTAFRGALRNGCGLTKIYNFYGMVEQIGTLFLEGEDGLLYPPAFADVIVRDPFTWQPLPAGEAGILQTLSLVPRSYPGHSLMTEDLGMIVHADAGIGGRMGKAIKVLGRAPKAELRGCSDVHAYEAAA
ncbi:MAG: acyl-protein synthetase [Alphaproteobacteria bacterium]|nr:acyl-protein synthetase [Alphaproteobacteria bacterium]